MLERMTIDGLIYELTTDHHNTIRVALVGGANPGLRAYQYDPFDRPDEWGNPPCRLEDIGAVRKPFLVQRTVLERIETWLRREKPYYFRYAISSPRRLRWYLRVAARLSKTHNYDFEMTTDGEFHFFKHTTPKASP